MNSFQELSLPGAVVKALQAMQFSAPTPIQAQAIPVALTDRDVMGCAQTGTGKTAAFSIPIIVKLLQSPQKKALILVPTRELAAQVSGVVQDLTRFVPELKAALLIGGAPMEGQRRVLRKNPRIIVATPGRLVDHLKQRTINLSQAEMLVLDEADRMLDIGFAPQLNEILRYVPKVRQTLMFSATVAPEVKKLAEKYLKDPVQVTIGAPSTAKADIEQKVLEVEHQKKNQVLLDALNEREGSVLVFARTQSRTDRLARYLESYGVQVARIHGGRTQGQRTRALGGFRSGEYRVLVATDIAARGIDIDHVAHVINYDLPQVPEDYIHRIGRTGRAGRKGEALSLITREDQQIWRSIRRLAGVGSATGESSASVAQTNAAPRSPSNGAHGKGKRNDSSQGGRSKNRGDRSRGFGNPAGGSHGGQRGSFKGGRAY